MVLYGIDNARFSLKKISDFLGNIQIFMVYYRTDNTTFSLKKISDFLKTIQTFLLAHQQVSLQTTAYELTSFMLIFLNCLYSQEISRQVPAGFLRSWSNKSLMFIFYIYSV